MNDNRYCDLLIDYYNGHLNAQEKQDFEKHLAECPDCQEELAEWEALNADLARNLEQIEPPADMEKRILTHIFNSDASEDEEKTTPADLKTKDEQKRPNAIYKKLMIPLAAALLLSVIGNVYQWNSEQDSETLSESLIDEGRAISLAPTSETADMDARMAMYESDGDQTVVLEARNFTDLNEGEVYQLWLLRGDEPYRAGTMVPNNNGEGYVVFTMDDGEDLNFDAVAITVENSPHNTTPQGDILMSADF